jgi:hypothetical protein
LLAVSSIGSTLDAYNVPEFEWYYVGLFEGRPAKEPIAASYSAPGVLAEAAHKTGRAKADFELREISSEEYERLRRIRLTNGVFSFEAIANGPITFAGLGGLNR